MSSVVSAGLPLGPSAPATDATAVKAAAEKFEGFFIGQLLREMRSSTREMSGEDSIYSSSTDQDMLDMADVALGDSLASQHAFGVADAILRQLLPAAPMDPGSAMDLGPFKNPTARVAWKK
jgi:peptidoglycan hydrolase FlgJ